MRFDYINSILSSRTRRIHLSFVCEYFSNTVGARLWPGFGGLVKPTVQSLPLTDSRFYTRCRKKIQWTILSAVLLLIVDAGTNAQDKFIVDLESALELAQADNLTLQMITDKEELALAEYQLAKAWWLPTITAGADMHQLWGNAMNSDGRIFENVDRQYFSAALGLNTELDFAEGKRTKKKNEYAYKARSFSSQIEKNNFLLDIIDAYYDMASALLEADAYRELMEQSVRIIEQQEFLVAEGLQYNTDLLLSKSRKEDYQFEIYNADNRYAFAKRKLLELLNIEADEVELKDNYILPVEVITDDLLSNYSDTLHPEYQYLLTAQEAKSTEYKIVKNSVLSPYLTFNGYTSLFGDAFGNISPTHSLNGGIGLSIPLARVSGKELQVLQIERSLIENELGIFRISSGLKIEELLTHITASRKQIDSAERAIELSANALGETVQRQELGLARPFEIEWAQEALIRSKINHIRAVVEHNKIQYELYVLLGNNL